MYFFLNNYDKTMTLKVFPLLREVLVILFVWPIKYFNLLSYACFYVHIALSLIKI